MADNTIDTLDIQISSSTEKAVRALTNLSNKLTEVNSALSGVNTNGLRSCVRELGKLKELDVGKMTSIADGIGKFSNSIKTMCGVDYKGSGLNAVINSINRLSQVDVSRFDSGKLGEIIRQLSNLTEIPDVSSGVNRFVNSMARLANSGEYIANVSAELPGLGSNLKSIAESFTSVGDISEPVNRLVQSIAQLASSGNKIGQTSSQLGTLAKEVLSFFDVMKTAPKISENTIRMTEALAKLANAGGKVNSATNSISSAFSKLSSATSSLGNIVSKTSSIIGTGVKGIIGWFQRLGNSSSGIKTASFNLGNLLKTAIGFKAIRGLANLGKSAIGFGSAITEIENVVDVSFGSMADEAYKFASTAKEQFGLSELAAKQYSGTMMAMMKSSGVAQDAASKMSISLAGLAGDIASFYNIDTDTAFQKIRSGISGEIEPLRQLGINLSVANMEAYALSRGITTSYNAMSQAEKVALRYNYLMSVTGDVQGDFARTSGTWANQVRLLTLNFQSLSAVIGQGLIAGILPAIQALNALMSKLMQAANAFRNFMYVLMGKKLKGSQSGVSDIVSNLGGIETAGDDASSGLDDATSSAKKLKKALSVLPFDQLNQLADNSDNSGTASKSLGSGLGDLADSFAGIQDSLDEVLTVDETPINKWAAKIRKAFINKDWQGLGSTIADMINVGMQKIYEVINWNNVGPKITEFVNAFTTAFNSMVSGIDFDLIGRMLGSGINTAVNTLNLLLGDGGIDFSGIGAKLSQLLKGAIKEIDWTGLGTLIGNSFMASWKMLSGFVKDMSKKDGAGITGWGKLGTAIGKALNGAIKKIDMNTIADALSGLLNGAFESLKSFTETFNWDDLATKIRDGIAKFIKETNWKENGQALGDFISHLCTALKDSLTKDTFYEFGQGVGTFLGELPWGEILGTAADLILGGLSSAFNGLVDGIKEDHPLVGSLVDILGKAFLVVNVLKVSGIGELAWNLIDHIGGKIIAKENADLIAEKLADVLGDGTSGAKEAIKDLGDAAESAGNGGFTTLAEKIKNLGDVAQTAGGQFQGFWGYATNLGATAFVMEGLGQVKKAMDFKDSTADAFNDFEVVRKALKILEDQTGISGDKFIGLGGDLKNVKDNAFDFDGQLQTVETSLENLGISSDTFKQALKQAMEESDTSTNSHVSNINEYIGTMGTEFDNAKSALERLSNQAVITPTQFDELSAVLQQQESSGATARAAFQALMDKMAEMGIDTGKVIKAFSEDVPKSSSTMSKSVETATKSISSNSKTGFGIASAAVSTAMAGMKKSTESTMPSIWSKIKNTNDDVETNSKTNWGNSASAVSTALGTMDTDTKDIMGKVMTTIQSYWSSVLINTNQIWEKASGKVDTETGKMLTYAENNMSSVARVFSSIRKTINGNFSGLYSVGLNAMNDFKRGIESVDIKTPHLQMNYTNWQEGNTHKWRWNSNVEWYAKGGLFNGAQVIGIGEAGSEAVLPLENPRTMKKIADSIVSSSDGSMGLTKEEMAKAVAQGVAMAMSMNSGNKNPQYIMNSIILDGSEIAKAVSKAQSDTDSRFKPSPAY